MRHDPQSVTWFLVLAVTLIYVAAGDKVTFKDDYDTTVGVREARIVPGFLPANETTEPSSVPESQRTTSRSRQSKDLLDLIGLGTGRHVDPYLAKINQACLGGDLAECFKSRALGAFVDFFDQPQYDLNENVKLVRMSRDVVDEVDGQPYEFAAEARSEDSEWDQMVKFAMRKAEKFIKTTAIEVNAPSWLKGENEVYAPRFIDEIADEIDTLENKKDTLFSRNRLKRVLIPLLIILKLFKLKLLLFLPLILGLASFKKFLGFVAIVIPGLIGFFKLYKPLTAHSYTPPIYTPSGIGFPQSHYKENYAYNDHDSYYPEQTSHHQQDTSYQASNDGVNYAHHLAYQGYRDYQK